MKTNKLLRTLTVHMLSVLMILSTLGAGLMVLGIDSTPEAYADSLSTIKKGDTVYMGVESTYYTGVPEWTVLDVVDSNNDGTADKAFLMSQYLWTGNGTNNASATLTFNAAGGGNEWDGSLAKAWCDTFYSKVLKSTPAVLSTDINDAASGAYAAVSSADNHVFFLSQTELLQKVGMTASVRVANLHDGVNVGDAKPWWLRSHKSDSTESAKAAYVLADGSLNTTLVQVSTPAARPAFYLDLSDDICASKGDDGAWHINVNDTTHHGATPTYTWAGNNSVCIAKMVCSDCSKEMAKETASGNAVTSEVTTEPTCSNKGERTYTATFSNSAFTTQTQKEEVPIDENAHEWDEGTVTTPSTCSAVGVKTFTCTHNSSHTKTEDVAIDENAHSWGEWVKLDDEQHQRVCANDSNHKETANHTWDAGTETTPATETAEGVKTFTCGDCGATKTEPIPKKASTKPSAPATAGPATISSSTVSAAAVKQVLQAAATNGGSTDTVVLEKGVKKISKNAFKGTNVKTIVVKTKKLKKKSVKGSLKGSKVTTVKVQVGKAKTNKKYVKKYKKFFTKKNAGKKVKVKK